ncbi:transcription elongation factor SPT6-like [Zophobas morio]|uniref:transcription elongation factor SPT6-like n=1 Tax=Zophobas morio TaxID=2755281 RepID=UPI003082D994
MSDSSFGASEEAISNVERRRKKKNSSFYGELDDDDYALIEENLGDLSQPTLYKHRRLRRKAEEVDKELQEELKDLQDDLKSEASGSEEEDPLQDELYSEDDIQDFIVDRERSSEFRGVGGNQDLFVAEEIFGDVDELFEEEIIHDEKLEDSLTLAELFEPAVLKKERMAAEDSDIRLKDVPERLQLLGIDRVNPENVDEAELEQEAEWIYYNLLLNEYTPRGEKLYITRGSLPSIVKVLSHFRKDFLEVPFIRMYRKQSYVNHLTDRELWILLEWDAKWNCFNNMKNSLLELLEKLKESLLLETTKSTTSIELESDSKLEFVGVVRTLIKESRTALELSDLRAFFMHHFYKELLELDLIKNVSHRRKSFLGKEEEVLLY